ncbi:PIG-L deacetylase family protein [Citrobacter cronae]|uniref:PIG-L deacetylase family protein n=1 Tax=Citrobacter cronae TaxID=1748967 RepID=UPI001C112892|nr:PIG-L deacetylase family protein [Citrobacter cronae]MBU5388665.1 PIG-L family deacetylase [Citrobacter cronae]
MKADNHPYKKGILAFGAHPDDIELGCGASISRLVSKGYYIIAIVMTTGSKGCNSIADRHNEAQAALDYLGCHKVFLLDFEDTYASNYISEMTQSLINIMTNQIPADIDFVRAYTMSDSDRHQDHRAVYKASIVACRNIPQILIYETPSNRLTFTPNVFEDINTNEFNNKIKALSFHSSQKDRAYMQTSELLTLAKFRGQQAGCELCEGFTVYKMIL